MASMASAAINPAMAVAGGCDGGPPGRRAAASRVTGRVFDGCAGAGRESRVESRVTRESTRESQCEFLSLAARESLPSLRLRDPPI